MQIIAVVESCIRDGLIHKIALRNAVALKADVSRRRAAEVIERYSGDDLVQHRWNFVRKARGAMAFVLHGNGAEPEREGPAATI